ncbi:MAG TPA: hypothetical protein DCW47_01065 [Lachnospiraceae bacterium]|nr:hypothetical protein [Lachnospiraceae bacterium]
MALDRLRQPPDNRDPYYQEEPDWMEYLERKNPQALNREEGVFDEKDETSINTAASVFEKGVVFSVGERET